MVELHPSKVAVESSNLFFRSNGLKVSKYAITLGNVKLHHKRDIGGVKSLAFSTFASVAQLIRAADL